MAGAISGRNVPDGLTGAACLHPLISECGTATDMRASGRTSGPPVSLWLPPDGMTGRFERFDPRPGGSYRLVLTYTDASHAAGKATADSDIVEARYVDIVPDVSVVQAVDFVSDDPAFAGTMTMTWKVTAVDGGTRVDITADDVPDGISAEDHATGLASSLAHLADYVEK